MPATHARTATRVTMLVIAFITATLWLTSAPAGAVEGETFAITEVDFGARTIEVTNYGDADVDPNGLIVCNFPDYAPISGAATLAPGASMTVDVASMNIPTDGSGGELGLYLNTAFEDPTAIVAYVEWGSTGHQRSSVAQAAQVGGTQVWAGGFVDPAGGSVLTTSVAFPTSPAQWSAQTGAALPRTGPVGLGTALVGGALLVAGLVLLTAGRRRSSTTS